MEEQNLKTIKETVEQFFQKTTFETELESFLEKEKTIFINLRVAEEPQVLIGEGGRTLSEIQHLLRAILRKKIKEIFFIDLDINNYKQKKYQYLKELARLAADEVALSKKEKQLAAMLSYERRIIHLELADRSDVLTESLGQGPERRIVIKPRP